MKYIHVKKLNKYHPGYKDRTLQWAKIYFTMVHGDIDFELIENEIDKWRLVAMILLELECKEPLPNLNRWWSKHFNIAVRPMSDTLSALSKHITVVTEEEKLEYVDKEEDIRKRKEIDTTYSDFASEFLKYNKKLFPKQLGSLRPIDWMKRVMDGANTVRKLVEIDGFTLPEIKAVLRWAVKDEFWQPQVISLAGLRRKSKSNGNTKFVNIYTKAKGHIKIEDDTLYTYACPDGCKDDEKYQTKNVNSYTRCNVCHKKRVKKDE